jgi:hypothetical protein
MADTKITALTAISTVDPAVDVLPIVDVSDTTMAASGTTKKITSNQILGAGGTATLASATITGDLTVDTSTLKVDSANNRVGIQITSPTAPLEVGETSGTALRLRRLTSGNTIDVNFYNTNTTVGDVAGIRCDGDGLANTYGAISFWTTQTPNSLVERYRISSVGVHTWQNVGGVASTAMTLNSTGLGVGVVPATNSALTIYKQNSSSILKVTNGPSANNCGITLESTGGNVVLNNGNGPFEISVGGSLRATVDTAGNVGVGVTPSASGGCLQLKSGITFPVTQVASSDANTLDDYEEGTFTPTIVGTSTAGTATYSVQTGLYTKVGRVVTIQIYIAWSGGTGTGNLSMYGLPFTAGGTNYGVLSAYPLNIALTAGYYLGASVNLNATTIGISQLPTGGGADAAVPYDAAGSLLLTGTYFV